MEGHCSTGQSRQWAVGGGGGEEEEEEEEVFLMYDICSSTHFHSHNVTRTTFSITAYTPKSFGLELILSIFSLTQLFSDDVVCIQFAFPTFRRGHIAFIFRVKGWAG